MSQNQSEPCARISTFQTPQNSASTGLVSAGQSSIKEDGSRYYGYCSEIEHKWGIVWNKYYVQVGGEKIEIVDPMLRKWYESVS